MTPQPTMTIMVKLWCKMAARRYRGFHPEDGEEAVSRACMVALKKPLCQEQAKAVFDWCRMSARRERLQNKKKFSQSPVCADCIEPLPNRPSAPELHQLRTAIGRLSEREQRIVRLYFLDGKTQAEVGSIESISRQRVRQILERSLERLRSLMEEP